MWGIGRAYKCNSRTVQPRAAFVFNHYMTDESDAALAAKIAAQLAAAKEQLLEQMIQMGCTPAKGWRIGEELRHTLAGTEFVFRPLHLREASPELHVKVVVDHQGRPAK